MTQIKKFFYTYTFLSLCQGLTIITGIVGISILARFLGPHEYGRYNLFILSTQILMLLATTWVLNPAAAKFASEEYLKTKSLKNTFSSELLIILINTIIVGIIFYFIHKKAAVFLGLENNFLIICIFIYSVVFALFGLLNFCFQGSLNFRTYGMMPFGRGIIFISLLLTGIVFKRIFSLNFVIASLVTSYLIAVIIFWPRLKKICPFTFDKKQIIEILSFSWPVIFFASGNFSLEWVDKYLINMLISTYAVGIYAAAWSLTTNFVLIPQLLYTIVMPIITAYRIEDKHNNISFYLTKLVPQLSLFFSLLIGLIIIFAKIFIPFLYGPKYTDSINIFIILSLSSLFMGIKYLYNPITTVFNFIRFTGSINLTTAFLSIGLNYLFIVKYGIIGAAFATAISSFISCIGVAFIINKKFSLLNFRAIYCGIPVIIIAGICMITRNIFFALSAMFVTSFFTYLLLKKYKLFYKTDVEYVEKIQMPFWLKSMVVKFYQTF